MESIVLEDVNDVLKREKLFKKHAMKYLQNISYKKPTYEKFTLLRTQKELDDLEKEYISTKNKNVKDIIIKSKESSKSNVDDTKDIDNDSDIEYEMELSRKERRSKNKKKYPSFLTKGKKKRETKQRQKSRRRRH